MPAGAKQHAHLILGLLQHVLVAALGGVADAGARAVNLKIRLDRDVDETVLRLAEHAALGLGHADHGERPAFDLDLFADGIARPANRFSSDRAPITATVESVPVFNVGEVAARGDFACRPSRAPIGGAAVQIDIWSEVCDPSETVTLRLALMPKSLHQRGMVLQIFELVRAQLRIPLLHLQVFLGIEIAEEGDVDDAKAVGAHVGNGVGDVDIHAVNHGHHRDQRGGGQDNAEQREEAAQLAGAQRIRRDGCGFAK